MSSGTSLNPYKAVAWHTESVRPEESPTTFTDLSNSLWRQAWETFKENEPRLAETYRARLPGCLALLDEPRRTPGTARDEIYMHQQQQIERAVTLLCKRSGWSERFIECAHGLVKFVQWSSDLVSAPISSHRYASLPWVGVSLILPAMLEASQQSEAMISGLDHVAKLIELYEIRSRQRQEQMSSGELRTAFVDMYRLLLGYQARVLLHLCHSVVERTIRNEYRAVQWEELIAPIEEVDANCSIFKACFDREAEQKQMTRQYEQYMPVHIEIPETIQSSELYRREQEIFSSFSSNYAADKNFHTTRVEGTCRWFLDDPTFKRWKDTSAARLLWLSAEPGRGKSVLARCLIDERHLLNSPTSTACYFFFNESTEGRHTAANALTAVLHQLLDQCQGADLIQYAMPRFKVYKEGLKENFQELWSIFIQAVSDPALGEVICILDGLDECEGANRELLLHALEEFYTRKPRPEAELKFLITSRPYHEIRSVFASMAPEVDLIHFVGDSRSSIIRDEINLVIAHRISKLTEHLSTDIQTAIRRQLETTRDATYLWVDLIFLEIESSLPTLSTAKKMNKKIRTLLSSLPSSVNKAYESILKKCRFPTEARIMFKIVIAARRPLTVLELNVAYEVATDPDIRSYRGENSIDLPGPDLQESQIRDFCGFFLTIHDSQVQFLHLTAKEYLLALPEFGGQTPDLLGWAISMQECELAMLEISKTVLALQELNQTHDWARDRAWYAWTEQEQQTIGQFPLFKYCAQYWLSHYRQCHIENNKLKEDIVALCDPSAPRLASWLSVHCFTIGQHPPLNEPSVVIGARFGVFEVVSAEVERLANPGEINYPVNKALSQAARYGQQKIVKFLLSRASNIPYTADGGLSDTVPKSMSTSLNNAGIDRTQSTGLYLIPGYLTIALEVACIKGHAGIVEALLQCGAQFDPRIITDTFKLGFATITDMLLDACPNLPFVRDWAVKTLNDTARDGCLPFLRLLLQSNFQDKISSTTDAVSLAVGRSDIATLQILLQPNLMDKISSITEAVSVAVDRSDIPTLQILLQPSLQDKISSITEAVSLAVRRGNLAILQMLLRPDLEDKISSATEAVILAVSVDDRTALNLLLQPNIKDKISSITEAMSIAADRGSHDAVQVLLASGIEISLGGLIGSLQKALVLGSDERHRKAARLLFEAGARLSYANAIAALDDERRIRLGIAFSKNIYCDLTWTGSGRTASTILLEALETDCKTPLLTAPYAKWTWLLKMLGECWPPPPVDAELQERLLVRAWKEDPRQIATVLRLRGNKEVIRNNFGATYLASKNERDQSDHLYVAKSTLEAYASRIQQIEDSNDPGPGHSALSVTDEIGEANTFREEDAFFAQPKPASWSVPLSTLRRFPPPPPPPSRDEQQWNYTEPFMGIEYWSDDDLL